MKRNECTCTQCGKKFYREPCRIVSEHTFCSHACYSKWRVGRFIPRSNKRVTVPCYVCGVAINRKRSEVARRSRQFCSHACQYEFQKTVEFQAFCSGGMKLVADIVQFYGPRFDNVLRMNWRTFCQVVSALPVPAREG